MLIPSCVFWEEPWLHDCKYHGEHGIGEDVFRANLVWTPLVLFMDINAGLVWSARGIDTRCLSGSVQQKCPMCEFLPIVIGRS